MLPILSTRQPFRVMPLVLGLYVMIASARTQAQEQNDLRYILDQRSQHQAVERERALLADELDAERPTITVDGKSYTVQHTANDVGRALYLSLQQKQWTAVRRFLDEYLTLPDRDPLLVHYAQGALKRSQGDYSSAEDEYRTLLALQPGFLPGRLELARVLFEDQQDLEAGRLLDAIAASLDASDPKTTGVRKSIATFQAALANRHHWSGSFAIGPAWNDNLNRSSAGTICLFYLSGSCFVTRTTPDAIVSTGYDYDANLNKRLPLRGHHGLYLRSLLFGQGYYNNSTYNELTSITQAGYSYRSGRNSVSLAPALEYYAWGNKALYGAWGAHAEWSWTRSPRALLKLEGDWKDIRYRRADYARNYDGPVRSIYATYFRILGQRWTVFGGLDLVDSSAMQNANGYLQKGIRLGASLQWPDGFSSTLFGSRRWRGYDAYSALLGDRRDDREDNYTLIVKATRWSFAGFTPLLTLRYNKVKSNVDWLYSYDKNVVSMKLERTF